MTLNVLKKFIVKFEFYNQEDEEPESKVIACCDTLDECIRKAREFVKVDPLNYFNSFEFHSFKEVNHNFCVQENDIEIIEGLKVPYMRAYLNMEEVMYEMMNDPNMEDLSIVYHMFR